MRISLIGSFVKWCAKKSFGGILNKIKSLNTEFRDLLSKEPFLACFAWFLMALLFSFVGAFIFGLILKLYPVSFLIPVASLCYLVYNIFYVAWQSFKRDRQQLFENIKQL